MTGAERQRRWRTNHPEIWKDRHTKSNQQRRDSGASHAWYLRNKEKVSANARRHRLELIRWFKDYKSKLSCIRCGESHPACLDFHHRDPKEKKFSVCRLALSGARKQLFAEIAKCSILCSNCHRKEHWTMRAATPIKEN